MLKDEKREKVRIKKLFIAMYNWRNGDKKIWDESQIINISEKGILITTLREFRAGDIMSIFIKIPTRPFEWTEFKVKVVESPEMRNIFDRTVAGMRITRAEFVVLEESQRKLLREYVAWFLSQKREEKNGL